MKKVVVVVRVKANGDPKLIILTISEGKNMAVSNPMIFSIESLKRYAFSSPRTKDKENWPSLSSSSTKSTSNEFHQGRRR